MDFSKLRAIASAFSETQIGVDARTATRRQVNHHVGEAIRAAATNIAPPVYATLIQTFGELNWTLRSSGANAEDENRLNALSLRLRVYEAEKHGQSLVVQHSFEVPPWHWLRDMPTIPGYHQVYDPVEVDAAKAAQIVDRFLAWGATATKRWVDAVSAQNADVAPEDRTRDP